MINKILSSALPYRLFEEQNNNLLKKNTLFWRFVFLQSVVVSSPLNSTGVFDCVEIMNSISCIQFKYPILLGRHCSLRKDHCQFSRRERTSLTEAHFLFKFTVDIGTLESCLSYHTPKQIHTHDAAELSCRSTLTQIHIFACDLNWCYKFCYDCLITLNKIS